MTTSIWPTSKTTVYEEEFTSCDHFYLAHPTRECTPVNCLGRSQGWATTRTDSRDTLRASASRSLAVAVSRSALDCPRASSAPTSASQHCRRSEWTKGSGVEPA